jgi:hypothetical protein
LKGANIYIDYQQLNCISYFLAKNFIRLSNLNLNFKVKNYKGTLVKWIEGEAMTAYSILLQGEDECEAEKFYLKYEDSVFTENLNLITAVINEFLKRGAREGRFRPEGAVHAIPTGDVALRFYCVRMNNNMVVFGNGGVKTSQKSQDSPDCEPHRLFMVAFAKEFQRKIAENELRWDSDNELTGMVKNAFNFEFGDHA